MIAGLNWTDCIIVAAIGLTTYKGFKRGFVAEIGGLVAIAAALIAPWYYNGAADGAIASFTKLGMGPAHVTGMFLTGAIAYVLVLVAAALLNRIAKLPLVGIGNALGGGIVGFLKGFIVVWLVLFVALFFPLTPAIRADVHASRLAAIVTQLDDPIDGAIQNTFPAFVRPFLSPIFTRHHL